MNITGQITAITTNITGRKDLETAVPIKMFWKGC